MFFFFFSQAADGRLARAEECGGWQEATAGLLRKTGIEEKGEKKKKEEEEVEGGFGFFSEGHLQRGRGLFRRAEDTTVSWRAQVWPSSQFWVFLFRYFYSVHAVNLFFSVIGLVDYCFGTILSELHAQLSPVTST